MRSEVGRLRGIMEAASGFEPLYEGFANPCLTAWLRRPVAFRVYTGPAEGQARLAGSAGSILTSRRRAARLTSG